MKLYLIDSEETAKKFKADTGYESSYKKDSLVIVIHKNNTVTFSFKEGKLTIKNFVELMNEALWQLSEKGHIELTPEKYYDLKKYVKILSGASRK